MIEYVLQNYFLNHKLDIKSIDITRKGDGGKIQIVNNSDRFFQGKFDCLTPNDVIWDKCLNEEIPFLFTNIKEQEVLNVLEDGSVIINYDIIGAIFYFLSGWQELNSENTTNYGRFSYKSSIQKKLNIIEIPVVNYYYSLLSQAICLAYGLKQIENKFEKLITFVSHDIDMIKKGWFQDAAHQFKKKRIKSALQIIVKRLFYKDNWYNFDRILKFENKRDISSTFFFLSRKGLAPNFTLKNADYNLNSKDLLLVLDDIRNNGSEIALHGSIGSGLSKEIMEEDIINFPSSVEGNRFHCLIYKIERLSQILEFNGIAYDSSLYFASHIGFRHSTCTPFYLYDFTEKRASKVLEIPLSIMDTTLRQQKYMGITKSETLKTCKKVINESIKFNGVLGILWHNNFYSDFKYKNWENVLEKLLDYAQSLGTDYLNGSQIRNKLTKQRNNENFNF